MTRISSAKRQAWSAYAAACDARHNHTDGCPRCWAGDSAYNGNCPTWRELSAAVERTLNTWMHI